VEYPKVEIPKNTLIPAAVQPASEPVQKAENTEAAQEGKAEDKHGA
jgi:hypothetical protein